MPPPSMTLVLPAFNEEARLGPALDELFDYLRAARSGEPSTGSAALPAGIRIIVVDDGSIDRTAALALERGAAASEMEAVSFEVLPVAHGGKGAAVRAGMLAADGDVVVFADADMATPPDQLPKLVSALERADVALGTRIQPDGSDMRASQPMYRRLLGRAFHFLASVWAVGEVEDTQCGFKGFRLEAAHDVFVRQQIRSIVFDVEVIFLCRRRGYRLEIVPIEWQDRRGSRMRTSPRLALRVAWDLFRIPLIHRRVKRAPRKQAADPPGAES